MCIAVYIPKNQDVTDEIINNCFENNPDGAGLMYQKDGKIHIQKGFFKAEELIQAYRKIPTTLNRAIHCRIATSGKISAECCHPFPITNDIKKMGRKNQTVNAAVIHNGVISFCSPNEGIKAPFSDTMLFTKEYLYPFGNLIMKTPFKKLFEESNSSKLLIFKENAVALIGKWTEDNGVFYSNTGYKSKWKSVYGYDWSHYLTKTHNSKDGNTKQNINEMDYADMYPIPILSFVCDKKLNTDPETVMERIVEELEMQRCCPDEFSAYETFCEQESTFSFEVEVMTLPVLPKVLGYEYTVLTDLY